MGHTLRSPTDCIARASRELAASSCSGSSISLLSLSRSKRNLNQGDTMDVNGYGETEDIFSVQSDIEFMVLDRLGH